MLFVKTNWRRLRQGVCFLFFTRLWQLQQESHFIRTWIVSPHSVYAVEIKRILYIYIVDDAILTIFVAIIGVLALLTTWDILPTVCFVSFFTMCTSLLGSSTISNLQILEVIVSLPFPRYGSSGFSCWVCLGLIYVRASNVTILRTYSCLWPISVNFYNSLKKNNDHPCFCGDSDGDWSPGPLKPSNWRGFFRR